LSEPGGKGSLREKVELWSALLLAAATVATAYSAYEATRWSGVQATAFTEAGANRTESAKALSAGYSLVTIDAGLFTEWGSAFIDGDERLQDGIERRLFRREFRPAFRAWLAQDPENNRASDKNPFTTDEYNVAELERSQKLERKATARFDEGREANQTSDNYVLATIFFAAVLFFAGIATKFSSDRVALGAMAFGTLVFLGGLARLITLPFY
jgi:ferric-dicitrate binding protein FerR (iron transport regulator)